MTRIFLALAVACAALPAHAQDFFEATNSTYNCSLHSNGISVSSYSLSSFPSWQAVVIRRDYSVAHAEFTSETACTAAITSASQLGDAKNPIIVSGCVLNGSTK